MAYMEGLLRTKWGFYQVDPLPTKEELSAYYAQKYYQEGKGSYSVSYAQEEEEHFRLKADLVYMKTMSLSKEVRNVLDLGCGEGWLMDRFYSSGCSVIGVDFSSYALEKFHPHLKACFIQGDVLLLVDDYISQGIKFDLITLLYCIEHVLDPVGLLAKIKKILSVNGILVILAPNDFSPFHEHILKNKHIDKPFWIVKPDHVSYFNKESMTNLLVDLGYEIKAVVGNNPIDFNIMNANSNYGKDPTKGKNTHYFRVRTDNFIASQGKSQLLEIYSILGSMGIGRDLYYYCVNKRD